MKRLTLPTILGYVLVCISLTGVVLKASGQSGEAGQQKSAKATEESGVNLNSTCTSINNFVDVGPPGPTTGDTYVWIDDLSLPDGSRKVGQAIGRCTLIDPSAGSFGCTVTGIFPGGTITTDLILYNVPGVASVGAITGGSGRFRDASGELSVDLGPPCGPHKLTIQLRPAPLKL